ncbi:MAG TPA: SURF1 family protein [Pseudomonadaceae bacterium]|nr:SURF1 family protein [Pseudomonadaceae bacterium]
MWQALGKFRFDWKLTLMVLLMLPLLLRLGFWQLAREDEKRALQEMYEARLAQVPESLEEAAERSDMQYLPVLIQGSYDNERYFLLDNRIHRGRVGYEVISPFTTVSGGVVFVNRGWIAATGDRQQLPEPAAVNGVVTIDGLVHVPLGDALILGESEPGEGWPKVVQEVEVPMLARLWEVAEGGMLFPYSVRLGPQTAGVLERNWTLISTSPEKHRGYAVQWFAMALALVLLYGYYSCRHREDDTGA